MKSAVRIKKRRNFLLVSRKALWIITPGLVAGFLAAIVVPGPGVPNSSVSSGLKPVPAQVRSVVPEESAQPNRPFVIFAATTIGLGIGVGLARFFGSRNDLNRRESELARLVKIPVLTSIPHIDDKESVLTNHQNRYRD